MRRPVLLLTVFVLLAFSLNSISAQPPLVDAALYIVNTPDCNQLEVRYRPTLDVTGQNHSAGIFTVRFPSSLGGTLTAISSPYGYALALTGIGEGGFDYYAFQFVETNFITLTAGMESVAATLQYSGGAVNGDFELTTGDPWTTAENGEYYIELSGQELAGVLYDADNGPDIPTASASPSSISAPASSTLRDC
jgi:hypothetical protein